MDVTLKQVIERLDEGGIGWALFAGAAAAAYGSPRPTTDIDILVPTVDVERVAELFPEADVRCCEAEHVGVFLPGFDIIGGLALMDLDGPMQARLTYHDMDGNQVPVIPAEDNILLKAIWGRGDAEGKHDWEDVTAMIAHRHEELDWDYLAWRASTLPADIDVDAILTHLHHLQAERVQSESATAKSASPRPSVPEPTTSEP